jgi:small basic protein (TIGR04137 family)
VGFLPGGGRVGKILELGDGRLYLVSLCTSKTHPRDPEMSQHNSFKSASSNLTKRNVLKRFERIDLLKKRGQWKDGDRVQGLRKTKPEE